MHEVEEKVKKLGELKEKIVCCFESELNKGINNIDTNEAGEVVDMIKDLAEAEKDCWKAFYYKTVVKAMKEQEEEKKRYDDMPSGYNHMHYANGRFAPSGSGHYVRGFMPEFMMNGYDDEEIYERMGYSSGNGRGGSSNNSGSGSSGRNSSGRGGSNSSSNSGGSGRSGYDSGDGNYGYNSNSNQGNGSRSGFGRSYDEYEDARRHYHESGSTKDKGEMDDKAVEHVREAMLTLDMIWDNADPDLKRKMQPVISSMTKKLSTV